MERQHYLPMNQVRITEGFWSARQRQVTDTVVPYMEKVLRDQLPEVEKSHGIENFRIAAGKAEGEFYGMVFQDSDVAKWIEAASYALALKPDAEMEKRLDEVIELVEGAQQPDGYLNTYFTIKEPENRWANLLECHELYCAGHMIEAAVANYEALGKTRLLGVAERLARHIIDRFGPGREPGIPGHEEIELALMRLYHATGERAYLDMATRFLDLRGQEPDFFVKHMPKDSKGFYGDYQINADNNVYNQSDVPVREQTRARGHAVRCMYLLTAMADAAEASGDREMEEACQRMLENITQRQMYVTGALGATAHMESFSADWELPNDLVYGETCASIAMVFFLNRMQRLRLKGSYADLMERELYNSVLSGISLDGRRYFYVNPLETIPGVSGSAPSYRHSLPERFRWHTCACCPPNLARLVASLSGYLWSENRMEKTLISHLTISNEMQSELADVELASRYPWEGRARYTLHPHTDDAFTLKLHVPGYVKEYELLLNGSPAEGVLEDGYLSLQRQWQEGDAVELRFALEPRRIYASSRVRADAGKTALAYGPMIYCLEDAEQPGPLSALRLPREAKLSAESRMDEKLGEVVVLKAEGLREIPSEELYGEEPPREEKTELTAIPYFAWGNRGLHAMSVWIRE